MSTQVKKQQIQFLQKEIWMLTYGASFQRANAYKKGASEKTKIHFKNMTTGYIEEVILPQYKKGGISDERHIANIKDISDYSKSFKELFQGGKINFGIAQKMLNVFLKYQWCLANIVEPPHFPVDRIIQIELIKSARKNEIALINLEAWTKLKDEKHYINVINLARAISKVDNHLGNFSPAQVELELFKRR